MNINEMFKCPTCEWLWGNQNEVDACPHVHNLVDPWCPICKAPAFFKGRCAQCKFCRSCQARNCEHFSRKTEYVLREEIEETILRLLKTIDDIRYDANAELEDISNDATAELGEEKFRFERTRGTVAGIEKVARLALEKAKTDGFDLDELHERHRRA